MAQRSEIEWTDATWNPVTGCTRIGPGCDHCYALRFAERWRGIPGHPYEQGFDLRLWPERIGIPMKWRKPRMIFVNSMSDLFHKKVPVEFVDAVFDTMEKADHHTYQVLTKRSSLMRCYIRRRYGDRLVPAHIWLGTSIENQHRLYRLNHLRQTRASVRFISFEPLLEHLGAVDLSGINWVIVGGESGPAARSLHPDWVRQLRDHCQNHGIAFFFKQWGGKNPRSGGRLLDGKLWTQFPTQYKFDV